MKIGIIGSGNIGLEFAGEFTKKGYQGERFFCCVNPFPR
jgi:3-hydroxyisobutyrate dehydrogenase-like beta-hydroxyacid dehydrogenase